MKTFTSIIFLLFSLTGTAQNLSFFEHLQIGNSLSPARGAVYLDSILRISKEHITSDTLALFYHKIGIKYHLLRDYPQAVIYTGHGKNIREKLHAGERDMTEELSRSYNNLVGFHRILYQQTNDLNHADSCILYAEKVIGLGANDKNINYVNACQELAMRYENSGDYEKSMGLYRTGIDFLTSKDRLTDRQKKYLANLYSNLSVMRNAHGLEASAEENLPHLIWAAEVYNELSAYTNLALVYEQIAYAQESLGTGEKAVTAFKKAIDLHEKISKESAPKYRTKAKKHLGTAWNNFGNFYLERQNYERALDCLNTALEIKEDLFGDGNHPAKAAVYVNIGEVYHAQKDYAKAVIFYHRSVENYVLNFKSGNITAQPGNLRLEKCSDKANLLYTLGKKAEVLADRYARDGKDEDAFVALHTLRSADNLIDIMRKNHSETNSKLFWRENTRHIYEQALSLAFATDKPADAFYYFEKSKSVLLLDAVSAAKARALIPSNLNAREIYLLQKYEAVREASTTDKRKHPAFVAYGDSLRQFRQSLAENYPRYYQTRYEVSVPDLSENGEVYADDNSTEYVHFFYGEKHIYTLRFGNGKLKMHRVVRNTETDILIQNYLQQFTAPSKILNDPAAYQNLAFRVYELLLQPLFPDDVFPESLVLLPDDFLNVLPFAALKIRAESDDNADYLLLQTDLRYAYSVNVLQSQKTPKNQAVRILGLAPFAATEGKRALPYSDYELKKAAENGGGKFITGAAANKDYFLKNAPAFGILHLSTHAAEKGEGGKPEIAFADGNLPLDSLYAMQFDHNLVILSACETGLGDVKKGEGVLSLNRGFTYAGAKSMISSLWKINEKSTGDILGKFYENIAAGDSKSIALNRAQRDFLRDADAVFQSPYYWAGLTYSGADGSVVLEGKGFGKFWIFAGLGVILFIAFFVFRKKISL